MSKIIKIESIETPEYVYDPVCEAPHAYIGNAITCHNCDEVDKSLGGIGGSGDSGTSNRVLSSFLTWLNDNESPVFTVFSANSIENLPMELTRKGRVDQIFAVGLPDAEERKDILRIHLDKRNWGDVFSDEKLDGVVRAMSGFVGAEIESAVKDALIDSFAEGKDLMVRHLLKASKATIPLSVSRAEQVQKMTLWAKAYAVPAGKLEETVAPISGGRRTRKPRIKETLQ